MEKIKIFKSLETQIIYIDTVDSALPEDFEYSKSGDLFSIKRKNTNIPLVARTSYNKFEGKDSNGDPVNFISSVQFETYLQEIFTQQSLGGGFFPLPIITAVSKTLFNRNEQSDIEITGSYFTAASEITIGEFNINSLEIVSASLIKANVTAINVDDLYDLEVSNESGTIVSSNIIEVKLSVWSDLRLGGTTVPNITTRAGMSVNRDAQGMFFTGSNPWSSWVKFNSLQWTRGENKTCQWIFTTPTANMMIGIGSTATNETSTSQFSQAEIQTYFNSGTNHWGLYGNNGNIGSAGNQNFNVPISANNVYKIKFESDGSQGGQYTLFQLPSANPQDWDNENNVLATRTIAGTLNPDESNIMPFIIPRAGDSQRFIAVKVQ